MSLTVSLGVDREVAVSTNETVIVNGNTRLQQIPIIPVITSSHPITSYSWSLGDSYGADNFSVGATFSNTTGTTESPDTLIQVAPVLAYYTVFLAVENSNGDTAVDSFILTVGAGLTGLKKIYWFDRIGGVYFYKYALQGEPADRFGYLQPIQQETQVNPEMVWDNERNGVDDNPAFNKYSRIFIETNARYITLRLATNWYQFNHPQARIGYKVDGVVVSGGVRIIGPSNSCCRIDLGNEGVMKTVEFVNGYQGVAGGLPSLSSHIRGIIYENDKIFNVLPPPNKASRIVFIGDSILSAQGEEHEFESMASLLRYAPYNLQTMYEAGGAIAFTMYSRSPARRLHLMNLLITANPAKIYFEHASNDAFLDNGWATHTEYGTAVTEFFNEYHIARPNTILYLQTVMPRNSNTWNIAEAYAPGNTIGSNLDQYRQVLRDYQAANPSWIRIIEGPDMLEYNQVNFPDTLHPMRVGQALMAQEAYPFLTENVIRTVYAGGDNTIVSPISTTTLSGSAVGDGLVSTTWSQIGNTPSVATIATPNSNTTNISGLIEGVYTFRFSATYANAAETITDDVLITVSSNNNSLPVVLVGGTVTTTETSYELSGSVTDSDGTIISTAWSLVSGPNTPSIISPMTLATTVSGLVIGTYVFKLTATDNLNGVGEASKTIIVEAAQSNLTLKGIKIIIQ